MRHFLGEDAPVRGKDFKPKHPPEEEKIKQQEEPCPIASAKAKRQRLCAYGVTENEAAGKLIYIEWNRRAIFLGIVSHFCE